MSNKQNDIYMENLVEHLDQELDMILNEPPNTDFLIENYTSDELHIMQRLLRQRGYKLNAHRIALLNLAESVKRSLNKPYLKGFKK